MNENDDKEFVRQLTLHQTAILAYLRSLMPGCSGAQDVLQETNIKLWEKKDDFTPGTNFKSWAFAVARFEMLGQRRRLQRKGWLVFSDSVAEQLADDLTEQESEHETELQALDRCLEKLSPHDLDLVRTRYASDRGLDDYARSLSRSSGTMKARLFKIRAALRRCVESSLAGKEVMP
ncbi:MAG: sigma-70 family RNA polymerase sigma factor [Verrucomicrobiae bacterium]|nr:sigma-70 family RNA polymerase sigma factor [Verrucomicrobiae bacterium]MCP5544877.1 sigma-70 family RNA polymerase sigma factor [Akkermansiaceae bacterium]MCP5547160.1 sigma-70 family RNA polymerase sigma factor [Akkermansiaceae bacterium]